MLFVPVVVSFLDTLDSVDSSEVSQRFGREAPFRIHGDVSDTSVLTISRFRKDVTVFVTGGNRIIFGFGSEDFSSLFGVRVVLIADQLSMNRFSQTQGLGHQGTNIAGEQEADNLRPVLFVWGCSMVPWAG